MIKRDLQTKIQDNLFKGKVITVIGARQVGKSTLMSKIVDGLNAKVLMLNCDEPEVMAMLSGANTHDLSLVIENRQYFLNQCLLRFSV